MRLSFGKIMGIKVDIHWTFALLILYIIYRNASEGQDIVHIGWSVLFVLGIFVCVTLHEFGHALTARKFGIHTKDITLYPIGGVARLERMPEKPIQELWVALAGPAVNVVIMLALSPFIFNEEFASSASRGNILINQDTYLPMMGIVNVWLALFNLIPAFPMDGGRVLRALLSMKINRVRATQIAATIGKIVAVLFVIWGFYSNPFLIFIGLFIILGAYTEAEMVKAQSFITHQSAGDAVMTDYKTLDFNQPISDAIALLLNGESKNFLVTRFGEPYGVVGRDQIIKGITTVGEHAPVGSIADNNLVTVDADLSLNELFQQFHQTGVPLILVLKGSRLLGVVDLENITEIIMINSARAKNSNV
ncbi:MAG: site-2 protease family protein [Chitinophagales bacterium]|nr:site-2 protease family protein [Chitinophagales bacterium]MDW8274023.1 site-2 protease family protein [Chitinophagales bacterium]